MFLVDRLEAISEDELAEEISGQYQGDLLMTDEQMKYYRKKKMGSKNGLINKRFRWPGATVPFKIAKRFYGNLNFVFVINFCVTTFSFK